MVCLTLLRHYKLSEYFFKQYEPYLLIDGFRIWKNKNYPSNNVPQYPKDTLETLVRTFHLNKLPYIWGQYDNHANYSKTRLPKEIEIKSFFAKADTLFALSIPENENAKENNTLVLGIKSKQKGRGKCTTSLF